MTDVPNFKVIPTRDELDQFERDLSFYPSTIEIPEVLARDDVERYNADGYLTGIPVFDESEIKELRGYFDRLLERTIASGGNSYSISTAHLKYGRVYDLLSHPRIVACVRDLLGPDVVGWGSHFFCKMPHDGKAVAWHQDASYWPLTPSKTVTVWLAIDDADVENACVRFIPGSHTQGHLTSPPSHDSDGNVLDQTVDNPEQFGKPFDNVLKAGEFSIHSDLLLHGSEANNSDRRRCGLTLRYCTPDVRAGEDWNQKGVFVSGADPSGHWTNPPRPDERYPG